MYLLHIGNDIILKKEEIIGIFNLDNLKAKEEFMNNYEQKLSENKIIKLNQKEEKSLIIVQKNQEILWYISNINSTTLQKRHNDFKRLKI